jgi:hypothetical protein
LQPRNLRNTSPGTSQALIQMMKRVERRRIVRRKERKENPK